MFFIHQNQSLLISCELVFKDIVLVFLHDLLAFISLPQPIEYNPEICNYLTLPRKEVWLNRHEHFMRSNNVSIKPFEVDQSLLRTSNNGIEIDKLEIFHFGLVNLANQNFVALLSGLHQ